MESPSPLKILAVYAVIFLVISSIAWFPRSWWTRLLVSRSGPSLTTVGRTRTEAWRAAGGFLLIGAISFGISIGSVAVGEWLFGAFDRSPTLNALSFMAAIGAMMGVGGALYLGVKGTFLPTALYRWHEDPLSQGEFLKAYDADDGSARVAIFEFPGSEYEVVAVEPAPDDVQPGVTPRVIDGMFLRTLLRTKSLDEAEQLARATTKHT